MNLIKQHSHVSHETPQNFIKNIDAKYFLASNLHSSRIYRFPGYATIEHRFQTPLDFTNQYFNAFTLNSTQRAQLPQEITVFAREYIADGGEHLPRLVYFQGGPGSAGNRPAPLGGWMKQMLAHYRIVMLDERGTGQSHAMDSIRISSISDPEVQAAYFACFRADHIIADAELLRILLQGSEKWSALGQSFGGFCITTYLSLAPEGLQEAYITAGLPALSRHADQVYEHTWKSLEHRNAQYFKEFPEDEATCWKIAEHLASCAEYLPTGERLTARRFRMLGMNLGWSYGFEKLHYLLEDPFIEISEAKPDHTDDTQEPENKSAHTSAHGNTTLTGACEPALRLSTRFLNALSGELSFAPNPLYWILHESIYAQRGVHRDSASENSNSAATSWSAHRVRDSFPQFRIPDPAEGVKGEQRLREWSEANGFGFRFSCEHVFPWQGEEDPALRALAPAAQILADFTDFPSLHFPDVLAENTVPVTAWIYRPDMFVPFALSIETAKQIRGLKPLISDVYDHDALRTYCDEIINGFMDSRQRT